MPETKINQTDSKGLRQGCWKSYLKGTKNIIWTAFYKNGIPDGYWEGLYPTTGYLRGKGYFNKGFPFGEELNFEKF